MVEKYVVKYVGDSGTEFLLTDVGMTPFLSVEDAQKRIEYFNKNGYLLNAKIFKLVEI